VFVCHCFVIAIAKLRKFRGTLRTKVDEIGCYCRKNMVFSVFSKKSFPENQARPRKPKSPFSVFYTPENKKKRRAPTGIQPSRAPKPLPTGMDIAKVTLFFINHVRFLFFRICSLWKTARPSPEQARTALFQPKTIIVSSFASKSRQQAQNKPQEKMIPIFKGRQCVWNPYPKAHPPFHFSKKDANCIENQSFTKYAKIFTFVVSE
jgi:hypothetical protein